MNKKSLLFFLILIIIPLYSINAIDYYYENLDSYEKLIYNDMYYAIKNKKETIDINLYDFENLSNIYYSLLNDKPQLFYITNKLNFSSKTVNNTIVSAKVLFNYKDYTNSEIDIIEQKLNTIKYNLYFETIGFTDFEIVKHCFDYLSKNSIYDIKNTDQSLVGVLIKNLGVCSSYAKAFKFLMDFYKIPCKLVEGNFISSNLNHVWNMVKLNGNWYHIDVTQANASNEYIDYSYLCIIENQIKKDHEIKSNIIIDKTMSDEFFYLNNINCYINSFQINKIQDMIKKHITQSKEPLILMFKNVDTYKKSVEYLINNKGFVKTLMSFGYFVENLNYYLNNLNNTVVFILDDVNKEKDLIFIKDYSKDTIKKEIINSSIKGNKTFKLLFTNFENFEAAKKLLINDQYIFELINDIREIKIIYYDYLYRFDFKI